MPIGQRQFGYSEFDRSRLPFFAQLRLHPLSDGLEMFAHRFVIRRLTNGQHFFQ